MRLICFVFAVACCAAVAGAQDETKVGIILPLSGEYSQFGTPVLKAMQLADKRLPGKALKLFVQDNPTCGAPDGVGAFKKLTEVDKVEVLITLCTAASKAILPLAKTKALPLIQLTEPGEQDEAYMVKMMPQSMTWNDLLADVYARRYQRMALVANSMEVNTGERGNVRVFTKRFEAAGGKIVLSEEFADDAADFRTLIAKIKNSRAQAVTPFIWNAKQLALFLKQADELKLREKVELVGNFVFEILYKDLLPLYPNLANLDGLMSVNFADTTSPEFAAAFKASYGAEPAQFADYGYDAIAMVKRCGADSACLVQPFNGASGAVRFDARRRRLGTTVLKRLEHGAFVAVR